MNNILEGVVEAVGDKFSGSLKINGQWISNKKGFINPAKKGDSVKVTLEDWEWEGKTGQRIIDLMVKSREEDKVGAVEKEEKAPRQAVSSGRDFDAEARGKCRHGLTVALAPLIATDSFTLEKAKLLINDLVEFSMTGR